MRATPITPAAPTARTSRSARRPRRPRSPAPPAHSRTPARRSHRARSRSPEPEASTSARRPRTPATRTQAPRRRRASFAGDANHTGSSDSKNFTIGQATSTTTVTCTAGPFAYTGSAITPCSVTVTGAGGLNLSPAPTYSGNTNAGTASASASFAGDANHTGSSDSKNFTIGQRSLTITAGDRTKTYGNLLVLGTSAFTTGSGELVNGDTIASVTLTSTGAPATANVGSHAVVPSAAVAGPATLLSNYDIHYANGNLEVGQRSLTITAGDRTKTYGNLLVLGTSAFTTGSGELVNGDTIASVTLTSTGAPATANVGSHAVVPSAAVAGPATLLSNYDIHYANGNLEVGQRSLTITAGDRTKTYGNLLVLGTSAFTTGSGELVNGDTIASVTLTSTGAPATANVGSHAVVPSAAVAGPATLLSNYDIHYANGNLEVGQRSLTITAGDRTKTYGNLLVLGTSAFTTGSGELVNGDTIASVTLTSTGAPATANVGSHAVVPSAAVAGPATLLSNYDIHYANGNLEVGQRSLTITAGDRTKTYGNLLVLGTSAFTTGSGELVNGDTIASVTLTSTGAPATANVGSHAVVPSAAVAGPATLLSNYDIHYANGNLEVGQRSLTITAGDRTKTYGNLLVLGTSAFTTGSGELVNGDTIASVTLTSTGAPATANVGSHAVVPSAAVAGPATLLSNYDIHYANGNLEVGQRSLTITAGDRTKTYGNLLVLGTSAFTTGSGELVNGDTIASVTLTSTGAAATANVGSHAVVPSAAVAGPATLLSNYDIHYANGNLEVGQRSLTITAGDRTKTYGNLLVLGTSAFTTGSGELVNGDTIASVTLTSTGAPATANVGSHAVVPSAAVAGPATLLSNYDIHYANGNLEVGQRSLTITAGDRTKTYGNLLVLGTSAFTTGSGELVNGDTIASVTLTSTGAPATANVGSHAVVPSAAVAGPATLLSNYDIHYANGNLEVGQRSLTITAGDRTKTYGNLLVLGTSAFTTGSGELVNGDTIASVTLTSTGAPATANVGSHAVVPSAAVAGPATLLSNYDIHYANGNLEVGKAELLVKADDQTKVLNAPNPTLTVTITGFKNGQTLATSGVTGSQAVTTTAMTTSPIGSYPITPTIGTLAASNYSFSFANGTLKIGYRWDGFLQPINDTAHQIGTNESKFKLGQTIPAKFLIKDANGVSVQQVGNPTFTKSYLGATCDNQTVTETVDTLTSTTGATFVWDGGQYHYNWSTKGLTAGEYRIYANLADGSANSVDICLTK